MAALVASRPAAPAGSVPSERLAHNQWAIALTVTMATFMELLDTSISNVSLPHIAGGLGTSYDESTWVLTSYLVANAIILPMSAWLSRAFGRKRYYMMCVALFTASSFLCGVAPSLAMLIAFRVMQGIGGGGLAPVEQAILVDTFPKEKLGGAFALYSMAMVTAPAIGPPLGGWITDNFSWRWVFFINVPIGILSLILSNRLVHDPVEFTEERMQARRSGHLRIDYVGITLIAVGFACLEVVLDRGERDDWLESHFIATFLAIAVVAIAIAIWWEWRHDDPVVELTLLRERNFAIANVYYFLFAFGLFGSTVLIPEMLQTLFGYTATDAGLALGPGAAVVTILAPFVVRIVPRVGVKRMLAFSFTVAALSFFYYSGMTIETDYFHFALARVFQGFGYAFMFIPVSQLAYSYLPEKQEQQRIEPDESLPQLGRQLRYRVRHHDARAAHAVSPERAGEQSHLRRCKRAAVREGLEPFPGDARSDHSRRDPSGVRNGPKHDDPAGDDARVHGLFSFARHDRAGGPAAGVPDPAFRNRQSGGRRALTVNDAARTARRRTPVNGDPKHRSQVRTR